MNKTIANGSLAHTVGNVTTLFTEFLKSVFPNNYFRHVHVNTRMAYREQKREENSKYEFIKKNKPILIIRPRVDLTNPDIFMTYSLFTTNLFGIDITNQAGNFMPFYLDYDAGCSISYMLNRIRVIFDCTILVDTEYEQINQYAYFINLFTSDRIYRMNTALEVYIPPSLMELVSAYSGVPIKDPDTNTTKKFLDYMMTHSNKYVTFKERNGSSTNDFFMFYPLSIDYVFTDITKDDPNKNNWAVNSCAINFTLSTEFNTVGIYNFTTTKQDKMEIGEDVNIKTKSGDIVNIIPYFTIGNLFDTIKSDNGYQLFYTQAFETEVDKAGAEDTLDISGIFEDTNAKDIIAYHNKNGIPNTVFIQIIIMKNNVKLVEGTDYTVDWTNLSVGIKNSDPDMTYRLVIFVNNLYVNDLLENLGDMNSTYEQQVGKVTDKTIRTREDNHIGKL